MITPMTENAIITEVFVSTSACSPTNALFTEAPAFDALPADGDVIAYLNLLVGSNSSDIVEI